MRLALLLLALAFVAPRSAGACPPGPCNKYRTFTGPRVEAQVQTYVRSSRALPPSRFDRRAIGAFLAGASWTPVSTLTPVTPNTIAARPLRFIAPDRASRTPTTERVAMLRQIERRNGATYVEIDGVFYTLDRCADPGTRVVNACLTYAGNLPEETQPATNQQFARPPR